MKKATFLMAVLLLALARSAQADFSQTWNLPVGTTIPDGSLVGWSTTVNLSGAPSQISDVNVTLNLSGGWNGDLYAYLVHDTGFAVLLNRVGVTANGSPGYGTAGMTVTLDDAAGLNIHDVMTPSGSLQPDGRNISPLTAGATLYAADPSGAILGSFNGLNANGAWTLFIADVSGGDVTTITSWGLDIAAVPEPRSIVEAGVAALFLGVLAGLYRMKQARGGLRPV
jgi:subtilisin-like proprotein convertase family protein